MANSNAMSGEEMQAKIQAARREAETLKDRIKRKKDDLQDTTRKYLRPTSSCRALG
jgi:guanine nucleotide-binding protein G(I)/G(S)/G(T) subunit beta-1